MTTWNPGGNVSDPVSQWLKKGVREWKTYRNAIHLKIERVADKDTAAVSQSPKHCDKLGGEYMIYGPVLPVSEDVEIQEDFWSARIWRSKISQSSWT